MDRHLNFIGRVLCLGVCAGLSAKRATSFLKLIFFWRLQVERPGLAFTFCVRDAHKEEGGGHKPGWGGEVVPAPQKSPQPPLPGCQMEGTNQAKKERGKKRCVLGGGSLWTFLRGGFGVRRRSWPRQRRGPRQRRARSTWHQSGTAPQHSSEPLNVAFPGCHELAPCHTPLCTEHRTGPPSEFVCQMKGGWLETDGLAGGCCGGSILS